MSDLEYIRKYIDDLLLTTKSDSQDHLHHLDVVFHRIKDAGLKVNTRKSFFEMSSNISDIGSPQRESNRYLRKWRQSTTLLCQRIHQNYTDSSVSSTTIVTHTISLSYMALLQDGTTCPYCELKIFKRVQKKTKTGRTSVKETPETDFHWCHQHGQIDPMLN
jgi:Reverse transcriptase (RNA-dependent DNA polymerase)